MRPAIKPSLLSAEGMSLIEGASRNFAARYASRAPLHCPTISYDAVVRARDEFGRVTTEQVTVTGLNRLDATNAILKVLRSRGLYLYAMIAYGDEE